MKTHTIEAIEHEEQLLKDLISSGTFPDTNAVFEAGITLLKAQLVRDEHTAKNQP